MDGNDNPLNASVKPPMFDDDADGGGGEAMSPNDGWR